MMRRRLILIPALSLVLVTGAFYSVHGALAFDGEQRWVNHEYGWDLHQEEMQTRFEERLSRAVARGEITPEQKQLILDKHLELMAYRQTTDDPEVYRAELQAEHDYILEWAQENGIKLRHLRMFGLRSGHSGLHRHGGIR